MAMKLNPGTSLLVSMLSLPIAQASELKAGDIAPQCDLHALASPDRKGFEQYKGKVLYVDFWASWCGPCAQSFPFMNKLHQELKGKGLEIIGINLDEEATDAEGFLKKTPAQFTILADNSGECPQKFGVKAMPSTYLIDRNGVVREVHLGFKPGEAEQFREQVEALLAAR
ncbi:TlpA disulfide reductase family protein [Methyloparacoccus murrellii]